MHLSQNIKPGTPRSPSSFLLGTFFCAQHTEVHKVFVGWLTATNLCGLATKKKKEKNKTESGESETTKKREKCWRKQKKKQKKSTNYTNVFLSIFCTIKIFAVSLRGYMKLPLTHSVVVM